MSVSGCPSSAFPEALCISFVTKSGQNYFENPVKNSFNDKYMKEGTGPST